MVEKDVSLIEDVKEHDIMVDDGKQYYSIKYTSSLMGVSPTTIRNYLKANKLTGIYKKYEFGNMRYVLADDVEKKMTEKDTKMVAYQNSKKMLVEVFQEQMQLAIRQENQVLIDKIELMSDELRKLNEKVDYYEKNASKPKRKWFWQRKYSEDEL